MSIATVSMILDRISVATPESRIAVFRTGSSHCWRLDSFFYDTVGGRIATERNLKNLIGIYDKTCPPSKQKLARNARIAAE